MTESEQPTSPHARRLTVVHTNDGWEVREHQDDTVIRVSRYTDWHRVERSLQNFERSDATPESH